MVRITITGSKKRPNPSEIFEGPQSKKQKMDTGMKTECRRILRTLMNHKWGSVFNQHVDPVELGIPDYFTVITHPMDLGTISKKLEDDNYSSAEVFCSDVRLTFSNAMRYNPPGNYVHLMANELYDHFGKSWELFEAKSLELSTSTPKKNAVILGIFVCVQMEKTAVIDDNFMELEKLCQFSWTENPLEKLGLRLKEEYHWC